MGSFFYPISCVYRIWNSALSQLYSGVSPPFMTGSPPCATGSPPLRKTCCVFCSVRTSYSPPLGQTRLLCSLRQLPSVEADSANLATKASRMFFRRGGDPFIRTLRVSTSGAQPGGNQPWELAHKRLNFGSDVSDSDFSIEIKLSAGFDVRSVIERKR